VFHSCLIPFALDKLFRRRVRKASAIPKRPHVGPLQSFEVTRPRRGVGLWIVFPRGVSGPVPGENNPAGRDVRYVSVPGFGGKANGRLPI
jgi:hypothetical protein